MFAVFHAPDAGTVAHSAVILCPPFGWDEVCAYRSLRSWGTRLACNGTPVLRPSLPSTGDSGGDARDPQRLEAWTSAICASAEWLRATTQVSRVAAIGLELGGLLAYRAASTGAPIEELVLWATPSRGRTLIRHLKAFSELEQEYFSRGLPTPPPLAPGELEAGGFLLAAATVRELEALDLTALPFSAAALPRVMVLGRDGIPPETRLVEHLQAAGAQVTVARGDGYGEMTSHPQTARPPWLTIGEIDTWLNPGPRGAQGAGGSPPLVCSTAARGESFTEKTVSIAQDFGALSGVLVEPRSQPGKDLCVVMLNAGAMRRIGPNRIWVEASRRWAQQGVVSLRLDLEGIGESDGDERPYGHDRGLYVERLVPQVIAALDWAQGQGCGDQFLLVGLCSGAYWALHAALSDLRVRVAFMINPRALVWDEGLASARDFRAFWSRPMSPGQIRRALRSHRIRIVLSWMVRTGGARARGRRPALPRGSGPRLTIDDVLDRLRRSTARAYFLFAADEPLHLELRRLGHLARLESWPNVKIEYVPVRDHTLRPNWAQQRVNQALDAALATELDVLASARADHVPDPTAPASQI